MKYPTDKLISGVTPENAHSEIDFGLAVGRELLPAWNQFFLSENQVTDDFMIERVSQEQQPRDDL